MSAPPTLTVLEGGRCAGPIRQDGVSHPPDSWNLGNAKVVEIVAPDHYCAALLLDHAAPLFPAQIVSDQGWIVRFKPPSARADWVIELFTLVEVWLSTAPLPCAKVRNGDREYLIRAPSNVTPTAPTPWEAA